MEVRDKVIVVTGAASGIGRALARRFDAEGARSVVSVDLDTEGAEATAAEIEGIALAADVSVEADIANVIETTEAQVGAIDLFCSNAGIGMGMDLDAPNEEWQKSWDVNVMCQGKRDRRNLGDSYAAIARQLGYTPKPSAGP